MRRYRGWHLGSSHERLNQLRDGSGVKRRRLPAHVESATSKRWWSSLSQPFFITPCDGLEGVGRAVPAID